MSSKKSQTRPLSNPNRSPTRPPVERLFAPRGQAVRSAAADTPLEVVSPVWIAKALGLTIVAALICAWLALCLLVYQGQWQLVLHPSHTVSATPVIPYQPIHFDSAATGSPRLTGWWVPAVEGARYGILTVLILHDGSGSLEATLPAVLSLHAAGLQVFAFDYRGFGASDPQHPTQQRMTEDTDAALDYLINTRHLSPASILVYGDGLGAALATGLAREHPVLPAIILDHPVPDLAATILGEQRTHLVPMHLLFREHFEIADTLATLATPKLLLLEQSSAPAVENLYSKAAPPAFILHLPPEDASSTFQSSLQRFLDQYVPRRP